MSPLQRFVERFAIGMAICMAFLAVGQGAWAVVS